MIKWVLFDQSRVQTYDVFSRKDTYSINGKKFTGKDLGSIFDLPEYRQFDIGKMSEEEFISLFLKRSKLNLNVGEFRRLFISAIIPINGTHDILEQLFPKFNLAVLTNEGSAWAKYKIEQSGNTHFFQHVLVSGDLGCRKPDALFYQKSLQIIGTKPEECLFIDDKERNTFVAEKLGIKSIVFENPEQLREELIKLKILK